jgi:uncharacterized protein (UPF0332 family)
VTEAERYIRKARESLASAGADVRAKRYNSAANRAYYSAFQAAVAALIHWRVRAADTDWEHRFVSAEFSSKLIRRRKVFARELGNVLPPLFELRIEADYRRTDVSAKAAGVALKRASVFVSAVSDKTRRGEIGESRAAYGASMKTKQARPPQAFLEDVKAKILENYPDVYFRVKRRGERDFTLEVFGDYPEMWSVRECLGDMTIDTLVDHDVWIVVLGLPRSEN